MKKINNLNYSVLFGLSLITCSIVSAQADKNENLKDSDGNQFTTINVNPRPEASVTISQDPKIKMLLDIKSKMEKNGDFSDRYKIQLYYGNLNKANDIMNKSKSNFKKWTTSIKWETPNYKVWLGNFRTRLEADRALKEIHGKFPSAFIFKPGKK